MANDRHQQAFEVYAATGSKRTYKHVADQLGVAERTVRHWAKVGKWKQRLGEREAQAARQMADHVIGSSIANASRQRKMVELALMKVLKAINSDKVKIQLGDLDRLLRLQAFLDGDGAVVTAEMFKHRPPLEVCDAFEEWIASMGEEELLRLRAMLVEHKANQQPALTLAALPAPDQPANSGESNGPPPGPTE